MNTINITKTQNYKVAGPPKSIQNQSVMKGEYEVAIKGTVETDVGKATNRDSHNGRSKQEEEEEQILQLFRPRSSSIVSEDDSDPEDWDETKSDKGTLVSASSATGLRQTEIQLKTAEKDFLSSDQVRSAHVSHKDLSDLFSKISVPKDPMMEEDHVERYMDTLVDSVVNDAVNTASPSMIGHMTSSLPYFMRPLSRLVTTMNQNVVKTETGNTTTFLEREAVAQLHSQLYRKDAAFYEEHAQDPKTVLGVFTSGGTLANVTALWVARNMALGPKASEELSDGSMGEVFDGVEVEGLPAALAYHGYKGAVVIGSALLHYSMGKAMGVLGLGTKSLVQIPFDEDFRVRIDLLEAALEDYSQRNILVVGVIGLAGGTETGSIDNLEEIARLSKKYGTHFHVDAAWGGPCIFSRKHQGMLKGIECADSVTLDGHKQLYMPMGCGLCFFKDPGMIMSVRKTAKYIIREDSYDLGKFTLEGSRPANAVYLHSNLNILGIKGYEILVDKSIRTATYMVKQIEASNGWFQPILKPMTNIILYRCVPPALQNKDPKSLSEEEHLEINALNVRLQDEQTLQGRTFVSRTTVCSPVYKNIPVVALRVVIANPLTCEADIDRVLRDQMEILTNLLDLDGGIQI